MDIINILLTIVSLIMCFISYLVVRAENSNINKIFSLFIISISLWSWGVLFYRITESTQIALYFSTFNYIVAYAIVAFFLHFSLLFPIDKVVKFRTRLLIYLPLSLFTVLILIEPNLILKDIIFINQEKIGHINTITYIAYSILFVIYVLLSYINLFKSYLFVNNRKIKIQIAMIIVGTILPFLIAMFFNLILPPFDYTYTWVGPLMGFAVAIVLIYSIYTYSLLNTKVIAAELLTTFFWILIIVQILTNKYDHGILISLLLLFLSLVFGIILIMSVEKIVRQKDLLRILNDTLEQRVNDKTREVKISYEHEKKARRDLEKLNETKDQFILITQHHLRSPVTNIRTELKKLISKFESSGDQETNDALARMKRSVIRLSKIIDDFLNITTLKAGEKILNVTDENIKPIIEEILSELDIDIKNMNIAVKYSEEISTWPNVKIDRQKVYEALLIIIENAVRYNRNEGLIEIKTRTEHDSFVIEIFNTGTGITFDEKVKLFSRAFYRSDRAKALHPIGMGIGLSVARAIIRAHHGDITISSNGENEGATVTITLPMDFIRKIGAII